MQRNQKEGDGRAMGLIERNAAIDLLNVGAELLKRVLDDADVVGAEREKYEWGLGLIESYISDIKELPSAQPEQKTAYWIPFDERFPWSSYRKCSECGFRVDLPYLIDFGIQSVDYCPHCKSKMEAKNET